MFTRPIKSPGTLLEYYYTVISPFTAYIYKHLVYMFTRPIKSPGTLLEYYYTVISPFTAYIKVYI